MKLGKLFIAGTLLFGSFGLQAQEKSNCDRMRFLANTAAKEKKYQEATMYYGLAEKECDGLTAAAWKNYLFSLRKAIRAQSDKTKKAQYTDSLNLAYERQEKAGLYNVKNDLTRAGYLLKGTKTDRAAAHKFYKRGIEAEKSTVKESRLTYAYWNAIELYKTLKEEEKATFKKELISDYFTYSKYMTDGNMSLKAQESLNSYFNTVVGSCEDITPEVDGYIANLPEDIEGAKAQLNNMITLFEKKNCTDAPEYKKLVEKLVELDPKDTKTQLALAKILDGSAKIAKLKEVKSITDDVELKEEIDYTIAYTYFKSRSYQAAYSAAIGVQGKHRGEALKIAAQCVAARANSCGDTTFDRKCNYLYAVQLLQQAQSAGASTGGLISSYQNLAPTSSDCFDNGSPSSVTLTCYGVTVKPCN